MTRRNPVTVLIFSVITCGIYGWVWLVKTKTELNRNGAVIPTAWIWVIPFVGSLYWHWKYSEGVQLVTRNAMSAPVSFLIMLFLGPIGWAILQNTYNTTATVQGYPVANP